MKLFLFSVVILFLLLMPLVKSTSCTPDTGFEWCYQKEENHGSASCNAKVQGNYASCVGVSQGDKCVGYWSTTIFIFGDNGYLTKMAPSFDIISCDNSGCSGNMNTETVSTGQFVLDEVNGNIPQYIITAWDHDSRSDGSWCYASVSGGYLGEFFPGLRVVQCLDSSQCSNGQICNTQTNVCETPVCTSFEYSNWTACLNNNQTRTINSSFPNDCAGGNPVLSQNCTIPVCNENWTCSSWSSCYSNSQSRTCTDSNSCNTTINKPILSQSCTSGTITNTNQTCWSLVNNICVSSQLTSCPSTSFSTESACINSVPINKPGFFQQYWPLLLVGIIGLGITFYFWEKRR